MRTLISLRWNGIEIGFSKITIRRAEKIKTDSIEVYFSQSDLFIAGNVIKFSEGDSLQVFAKNDFDGSSLNTSVTSPDLLFNGVIKEISLKKDSKRNQVKLKGVSRTYELMNRIWSKQYDGKVPNILKNIIDFTSFGADGSYRITATVDTGYPYTSGIQGKRPNNSDFPDIQFGLAHKPVYEFVEELSQTQYTNSQSEIQNESLVCKRPFKYYVDGRNKFHWFYPSDTPDYIMEYGATGAIGSDTKYHRILKVDLRYSQFNEVNFIIYKAGEDMNNVQILDYAIDPTAKSLTTADSFRSWLHISRVMKQQDARAGHITFDKADKYNYPSSYPVTPAWNTSVSVTDDSDYNDEFRKEAIRRADAKCKAEFDKTGNPRWKGKITLIGEPFEPTEMIQYTDSTVGMNNVNLRVKDVTHNIDKTSFTTTINVEEDIPEVA